MRKYLYDKKAIDFSNLMFSNQDLYRLMIPLVIQQFLTSFMGMADTMMVSRIGSAAISAVSLTDSINVLVIQMFDALAAGGTILCAQYIGHRDGRRTQQAAEQILITVLALSAFIGAACFLWKRPLLSRIFGSVEADVMESAVIYFSLTSISFPFLAVFQAGSAFFRAGGNSSFPMRISVLSNFLNIAGNAVLIFVLHWGVFGAALATLLSRVFCAVVVMARLRDPIGQIVIRSFMIRPEGSLIGKFLSIGLPSGIENSMFQFGKLVIQSTVSTLGTTAIAAQAMAIILENLNGMAATGIGIGMATVVGTCLGAGRKEEARYNLVKLSAWSEVSIILSCLLILAMTIPVTRLAGMEAQSASMCFRMVAFISVTKPLFWVLSYSLPYGFPAAGDVRYSMIVTILTMWLCRVVLTVWLIRGLGMGPMAVWIGMSTDWAVRSVIFTIRFFNGKWLEHSVV